MAIRVALHHRSTYVYDRRVWLSPQVIRLRPAPHARTPIRSYTLKVAPKEHLLNWQQDPFGNFLARVVLPEATQRFEVQVDLVADLHAINPFDFFLEPEVEHWPFRYEPALAKDLAPYREAAAAGPRLNAFLATLPRERTRSIDFLVELNRRVYAAVEYVIRMQPGVQAPDETLEKARGSCRDSAWLLVQALRHLGLAARFASGYLIQLLADAKPSHGLEGAARDFTDLHAWAEVFLPGAGWVGLDATSGLFTGEGHIPLACTPETTSAAPLSGQVEVCGVSFEHAMSVQRICAARWNSQHVSLECPSPRGGGHARFRRDARARRGAGALPARPRMARQGAGAGLELRRREAELLFRRIGITFAVYTEGGDPERLIPFDIIPRVLDAGEWARLARGLEQRVRALNAFLHDVYDEREILRAGRIRRGADPAQPGLPPEMQAFEPPAGGYAHVAGHRRRARGAGGLLRARGQLPHAVGRLLHAGEPRGDAAAAAGPVSRSIASRRSRTTRRSCFETLRSVAPRRLPRRPRAWSLLTPGAFNSAYYEHSFLADEMGVELVEGADLFVDDAIVYMRTTEGPQRVDVIYRRIDDDFLDPLAFRDGLAARRARASSRAYRAGNVTLANAVGTGIADDKGDLPLRARDDPLLPRRGAAARPTCRPGAAPSPTTLRLRARAPRRAGRQGRRAARAATAC